MFQGDGGLIEEDSEAFKVLQAGPLKKQKIMVAENIDNHTYVEPSMSIKHDKLHGPKVLAVTDPQLLDKNNEN